MSILVRLQRQCNGCLRRIGRVRLPYSLLWDDGFWLLGRREKKKICSYILEIGGKGKVDCKTHFTILHVSGFGHRNMLISSWAEEGVIIWSYYLLYSFVVII